MEIKIDLPMAIYIIVCIIFLYQAFKTRDSYTGGYFGDAFDTFFSFLWLVGIMVVTLIYGGIFWW